MITAAVWLVVGFGIGWYRFYLPRLRRIRRKQQQRRDRSLDRVIARNAARVYAESLRKERQRHGLHVNPLHIVSVRSAN